MSTIFLHIYFIGYILFYIFFQLNYTFSWCKEIELDDAFDCVFLGFFISLFWPLFIIVYPITKLMTWMDNMHDKHKYKQYEN